MKLLTAIRVATSLDLLVAKAHNAILVSDNRRLRETMRSKSFHLAASEELAKKLGEVRDVLGGGHVGARPETTVEAARRVVAERDELREHPMYVAHTNADERILELEEDNAKLTQELANVRRVHLDTLSSRDAELERQREKLLQARDERIRLSEIAQLGVNVAARNALENLVPVVTAEPLSMMAERVAEEFNRMRNELAGNDDYPSPLQSAIAGLPG